MSSYTLPRALQRTIWRSLLSLRRRRYSSEPVQRFSEIRGLNPRILEKLTQQNLSETTDIQAKCLPALISEDSHTKLTVINAETGSGKTLCFLIPILQLLTRKSEETWRKVPVPLSLVLVPTSHLAHQIKDVFKSLALAGWGSSLSYKGSKLSLKSDTHLVLATPSSLANFSLTRLLENVKILCIDEADVLLTGSERQMTWNILEEMRRRYRSDIKSLKNHFLAVPRDNSAPESDVADKFRSNETSNCSPIHRQIIFSAATLPSRGRQSVRAQLMRWVPKDTLFFVTARTHQIVPLAQMRFIKVQSGDLEETTTYGLNTKLEQLSKDLMTIAESVSHDSNISSSTNEAELQLPKVLIFTNTVASAEEIFTHLERIAENQADVWWKAKIGQLHKQSSVNAEEKERTLHDFRTGSCRVLVSTDLASRGLDLPDVTTVIQVDFPTNSADFLHRAGRTARAGKSGTVISYVGKTDEDMAREVREVVEDEKKSFDTIFSRNKMLRRTINRKKAALNIQG